jgi:LytS/YehU family sensor histidine kinase
MKSLAWLALIAGLVPVQSILLPHASPWSVIPDIGLIMVCLAGLFGGELHGLLVGLALGCAMSLFSAMDPATSMVTKGAVGFLAGLAGRHVVYLSPLVFAAGILVASCLSGVLTASLLKLNEQQGLWWVVRTVVLPQAGMDSVLAGALYWVAWNRLNVERWIAEYRM